MEAADKTREKSELRGIVSRIVYRQPETHYTVARLEIDGAASVTVVGQMYPVAEGEEVKVGGFWRSHPRYGLQFQVEHWQKLDPATVEGIEKYLGSGLIKGIGPVYAKRLVAAFGLDTLRVLSEEPLRILEVEGIGELRARRIMEAWQAQRGMQDVMVFLQGHGISPALSMRIYRTYGAASVMTVKETPYRLARDVHGIGFMLADRIAANLGVRADSPERVAAGVYHVLGQFAERGHCYAALDVLRRQVASLLQVEEDRIDPAVESLARGGDVVVDEKSKDQSARVYMADLYEAERRVGEAIRRLLSTPSFLQSEAAARPWDKGKSGARGALDLARSDLFAGLPIRLDEEQIRAARQALEQKVFIVTGGPGTGKTTLLISLLAVLRRAHVGFALAAPTGRAAKRMSETAGEEAMTLHRLLEYNPREGRFQRNEDNPIQAEVVIVDEASMIDIVLMDRLLSAIEPHTHLILIGDVDQLPSVGPGSVLRDLIDSGTVPVAVLKRIFRQKQQSLIVVNAHRILRGHPLEFAGAREQRDFDFIARESEQEILHTVKELVCERLPRRLNLSANDLMHGIQVLTPMHRGLLGTIHLNRELQALLNPAGEALERGGSLLRVGDKVMQLRNNYDKGVFNGDLGQITSIDREDGKVRVEFDERAIEYEADTLDEITLAYATSVHKSQGSEYPAVILPLHTSHYMMLHRSILYTAVTRGKNLVVVVGSRKALAIAIRNIRVERRNTGLRERLAV
ncbi:MAG TPA: ATP-dependent RecD-like DNA helicase [Candidatus Eisenbacteria bacterium]|nr:ATP-dependent RecD-like DNA helicase [Candidatus Eisenbacteria bacterium]